MAEQNQLAILKKDTVDVVASRVRQFMENGELHLPANYSPENSMKSAWLILQNTMDRDKKPALAVCTKDSIANSLLDMVVQGLNPAKKQGYFIVYGKQLVFQRSYFGTMAVTKQVDDTIQDIIAEVVYEGDTFKYRINRGRKEITEHEQALENIDGKKIKAAYCMIIDFDGNIRKTEIMTIAEIKQAWKQSQMRPVDEKGNVNPGSTHGKFAAEMCKKTVINKTCKSIINSSSDSHLFKHSFNRASEIVAEQEVAQEIAEHANTETIDVEATGYEDAPDDELTDAVQDDRPGAYEEWQRRETSPKPTDTEGPGF